MFTDKVNEVLERKKPFFSDRKISWGFGVSGILNIIHWLVLYIKIKPGKANILLHYNVIYGPDLINKSLYLYLIPFLALVVFFINFYIASIFYKKEKLSAYFLSIATIPIQLIFFIASLVLITVNE